MTSTSETPQNNQFRTYNRESSIVFLKTKERFGGLSNMAPGFPLQVNGVRIRTSEALYQACRFPHMPDVQRLIINERSPMTAKMRSKPYRKVSRSDWNAVRVKIMRWSLRVKLAQNWSEFGRLLLATGDRPIVEQSRKDDFWGAKVAENGTLVGMNVLGRLLMELRELLKSGEADQLHTVEPLTIPEFLLFEQPIQSIGHADEFIRPDGDAVPEDYPDHAPQPSLFDQQVATNGLEGGQGNHPDRFAGSKVIKPYPAYRDSRSPWLGDVPEHWDVRRNGRLFAQRNETGFDELPILEVSLRTGVRVRDFENGSRKQQMTDRSKYKRAAKGDIAYNMMRMWQGAVGVAPEDGLISPAYVVARPFPEVEPRYYAYLFRTKSYMREVNKYSRGIVSDRNRLYWDDFKQMPSPFPPTKEQARIADFLDVHGKHTTRLIRNKRRLIALLNEQKQGIINRAVTRGLDPTAPMKPTGIDWMSEVPAHWEVKSLKQVCSVQFSNVDKHSLAGEKPVLLCNYTDVYKNDFIGSTLDFMAATATDGEIARFSLKPGDVMITKDSEAWDDIGVPALVHEPLERVLCGYHLALLRSKQEMLTPEFLFYAFSATSIMQQLHVAASGVTRYGLSKLSIKNTLLPIPDTVAEQQSIVEQIVKQTAPIDKAKKRIDQEITLIQEYRQRLIVDVVTGKLDVRGVDLPEVDDDTAATLDTPLDAAPEPAEVSV